MKTIMHEYSSSDYATAAGQNFLSTLVHTKQRIDKHPHLPRQDRAVVHSLTHSLTNSHHCIHGAEQVQNAENNCGRKSVEGDVLTSWSVCVCVCVYAPYSDRAVGGQGVQIWVRRNWPGDHLTDRSTQYAQSHCFA